MNDKAQLGYIVISMPFIIAIVILLILVGSSQNYENSIIGRCHNGNPLINGCTDIRYNNSELRNASLNRTIHGDVIGDPFTGGRGGAYTGGRGW